MRVAPVRLEYQLDVYTVDRLSNDEIYRELYFYFLKHPTLEVPIPYTVNGSHYFNIEMDSDVVDNSDTVAHIDKGVLYRYTSTWVVSDAYIVEGTTEYSRVPRAIIQLDNKDSQEVVDNGLCCTQ